MIEYTVRVYNTGEKSWYLNGKLHREDGPAYEFVNGDKYWLLNGRRHRVDGPACEYTSGAKFWYLNGNLHREDGPAIEFVDGSKRWFLNGIQFSEEEFLRRTSPELQVIKDLRVVAEKHGYKLIKEGE